MDKNAALDDLKKKIIKDKITPELAKNAKNMVFGEGDVDAKVVLVGEAPGKKEDESGKPFVGASGKLLDEMLVQNNMNRGDVYITNIVKYRPPENRDPSQEEKSAFLPYLIEQMNIIKPKVVATLGRHSGLAFSESLHISADHGKPKEIDLYGEGGNKVIFVPLYHPAAAIYNRSLRETLFQDFAILKELIK